MSAQRRRPGPATALRTDGLTDGWYRLSQRAAPGEDGVATGVFQVRTGTRPAAPTPTHESS